MNIQRTATRQSSLDRCIPLPTFFVFSGFLSVGISPPSMMLFTPHPQEPFDNIVGLARFLIVHRCYVRTFARTLMHLKIGSCSIRR